MPRLHRPTSAAIAALTAALALAACGSSSESKQVAEGQPLTLGHVKYEVVFSRYLNRNDREDSAYLVGQPPPPPGSSYFGVFLVADNESDEAQSLPGTLTLSDVDHREFAAVRSKSLFALPLGGSIEPNGRVPVLDSPAQTGPIGGSLVIFEVPQSVSEARPLTLDIPGPGGPGEVELDF